MGTEWGRSLNFTSHGVWSRSGWGRSERAVSEKCGLCWHGVCSKCGVMVSRDRVGVECEYYTA